MKKVIWVLVDEDGDVEAFLHKKHALTNKAAYDKYYVPGAPYKLYKYVLDKKVKD